MQHANYTLFDTDAHEVDGCIYTNLKDECEQLTWILTVHDVSKDHSFMHCNLYIPFHVGFKLILLCDVWGGEEDT